AAAARPVPRAPTPRASPPGRARSCVLLLRSSTRKRILRHRPRARVRAATIRGHLMRSYVVRRLIQFVPVLLAIALVTFAIVRLAPGDPVALMVDVNLLSADELRRFRG